MEYRIFDPETLFLGHFWVIFDLKTNILIFLWNYDYSICNIPYVWNMYGIKSVPNFVKVQNLENSVFRRALLLNYFLGILNWHLATRRDKNLDLQMETEWDTKHEQSYEIILKIQIEKSWRKNRDQESEVTSNIRAYFFS
jgi:hypothetical protein